MQNMNKNKSGNWKPRNKNSDKQHEPQVIKKRERPTSTHLTKAELNERWWREIEAAKNGQATTKSLEEIREEQDALYIWRQQEIASELRRKQNK